MTLLLLIATIYTGSRKSNEGSYRADGRIATHCCSSLRIAVVNIQSQQVDRCTASVFSWYVIQHQSHSRTHASRKSLPNRCVFVKETCGACFAERWHDPHTDVIHKHACGCTHKHARILQKFYLFVHVSLYTSCYQGSLIWINTHLNHCIPMGQASCATVAAAPVCTEAVHVRMPLFTTSKTKSYCCAVWCATRRTDHNKICLSIVLPVTTWVTCLSRTHLMILKGSQFHSGWIEIVQYANSTKVWSLKPCHSHTYSDTRTCRKFVGRNWCNVERCKHSQRVPCTKQQIACNGQWSRWSLPEHSCVCGTYCITCSDRYGFPCILPCRFTEIDNLVVYQFRVGAHQNKPRAFVRERKEFPCLFPSFADERTCEDAILRDVQSEVDGRNAKQLWQLWWTARQSHQGRERLVFTQQEVWQVAVVGIVQLERRAYEFGFPWNYGNSNKK